MFSEIKMFNINYCKDHRCPDSSNEW